MGEGFDETGGVAQVGELGIILARELFDSCGRDRGVRAKGGMWVEHRKGSFHRKQIVVKTKKKDW